MGHQVVLTGRNGKQNLVAADFSGGEPLAADVSRLESVRDLFPQVLPNTVLYAAATKFADLAEKQPMEAIDVNVIGSQNVVRGDSQLVTRRSWVISMLKYFPYRCFLSRLDAYLYVGQRNKAYLQHYGVPESKLFFAPHSVDNDFFVKYAREAEATGKHWKVRAELGIPKDAFVFLFVGKMIPKKRPADFLRAYLKVLSLPDASNIHALLVGDGPLRASLELLAHPHRNRIRFNGFSNQSEVPAFYKASNALVLPSDGGETWGLVVNEAMACGIPAVVSDAVGCAPDMIDEGRTGFTYPVGNVEVLARRMVELKEICERKPLSIRQAVDEKIACYSIERATEGLESALEAVATK